MSTPLWINDPSILFKHDKLKDLWPTKDMNLEEKINTITRLIIFLTLFGFFITISYKFLLIGFTAIFAIVVIYLIQRRIESKEGFSTKPSEVYSYLTNPKLYDENKNKFAKPSVQNPLMNVLIPEVIYHPQRKPAAPTYNPTVEKEINSSVKQFIVKSFDDKNIGKKLFGDTGEEIQFDRSMLPWTATPNTQIPNDQKNYLEFLYGSMISGKDGHPLALERIHSGAYNYKMY